MRVSLVWITPDAEQVIGYCARVSSPENQGKDATKLLRSCVERAEWSPFEMASACVEITTSRAIGRQILRHRSFSFQEFSQRWAEAVEFEPVALRKEVRGHGASSEEHWDSWSPGEIDDLQEQIGGVYRRLLERGVARECARMILPECTQTRLYMSGTIRSWLHYLNLRLKKPTQLEHRRVAWAIVEALQPHLPLLLDGSSMEQ